MSQYIIVVAGTIASEADDVDTAVREALANGHDVDDMVAYERLGAITATFQIA